jgi:hypothetical protein
MSDCFLIWCLQASLFRDEMALLIHKAKQKSYHGLATWVEHFREVFFFP